MVAGVSVRSLSGSMSVRERTNRGRGEAISSGDHEGMSGRRRGPGVQEARRSRVVVQSLPGSRRSLRVRTLVPRKVLSETIQALADGRPRLLKVY